LRSSPGELPQQDIFLSNRQYFAEQAGRPLELVERRFESVGQAIRALKTGEIHVLDRVNPWSLGTLRGVPGVKVKAYAQPLVHCLVPNLDKTRHPFVADRNFRRALLYGINRDQIINYLFAGALAKPNESGSMLPRGCGVTSSPFPSGVGATDPMSYASDDSIEPRPYEPRLAVALVAAVQKRFADEKKKNEPQDPNQPKDQPKDQAKEENKDQNKDEKKDPAKEENKEQTGDEGEEKPKPPPPKPKPRPRVPLVLAYPADEIAKAACESIKLQLQPIGIDLTLRPLSGELPQRVPDDVDLLYVELASWEPVVDARRILGDCGMAGGGSLYMSLALRQLDEAVEWSRVRDCLRRIHRIAYDDVALMPLWQAVEYYAYHESLKGLAAQPVSLYQNVEQWRPEFQYPTEP
jgi:ABC-type transport system substrate-binding protein